MVNLWIMVNQAVDGHRLVHKHKPPHPHSVSHSAIFNFVKQCQHCLAVGLAAVSPRPEEHMYVFAVTLSLVTGNAWLKIFRCPRGTGIHYTPIHDLLRQGLGGRSKLLRAWYRPRETILSLLVRGQAALAWIPSQRGIVSSASHEGIKIA